MRGDVGFLQLLSHGSHGLRDGSMRVDSCSCVDGRWCLGLGLGLALGIGVGVRTRGGREGGVCGVFCGLWFVS